MKASKLSSGKYRVNLYLGKVDGKEIRKSITARTKREAEQKAAAYLSENHLDDTPMTVGDAVDKYIQDAEVSLSPSTINGYRQIQRCYISGITSYMADRITRDDVQKWVNALARVHSPKTVRNAYGLVHAAILSVRPEFSPNIKLPKKDAAEVLIPSKDDIHLMLSAASEKLRLCIMLGAFCGMRRGEICYLRYRDVKDGCIHIHGDMVKGPDGLWSEKNRAKTEKSNRVIRVPEFVLKEIGAGAPDAKVVGVLPSWITWHFGALMKKLGLPYHFHLLRHFFASTLISKGVPRAYVQSLGGWENGGALDRIYTHIFQTSQNEYSQMVSDLFSKDFRDDFS